MEIGPHLWQAYLRTVIDLELPTGRIRLHPAPVGETDGEHPTGTPLFVVTAWNPGSQRLPAEANEARNAALAAELASHGLRHWPAVGRGADGAWPAEHGFVISGLSETSAHDIGRRHGQHAVFRWSPDALAVVACFEEDERRVGWHAQRV